MTATLTPTITTLVAATATTPAKLLTTYGTGNLAVRTTRKDGSVTIRRIPNTRANRSRIQGMVDILGTAPSTVEVVAFIGKGRTGEPIATSA